MRPTSRILIAAVLATAAASANADGRMAAANDSGRSARVLAAQAVKQRLLTRTAPGSAPKAANAPAVSVPPLPSINPLAAYPPSCLADPIPDQTSGPTYSTTVNLAAYDSNSNQFVLEGVTITIWRVACSSSEFFNSATLMRIQRQSAFEGDNVIYPLFPSIEINQGSIGFGDAPESYVRMATSPNTRFADTLVDTPIIQSSTYILENYSGAGAGYFDFNLAFGMRFNNLFNSNNFFFLNVPTYNPTVGTYPSAFQNIPVSGYLSTSWYNPATSGEGIVMQVYELLDDSQNFIVNFTWSAYDPSGLPFWLTGQVTVPRGTRTVTTPMAYVTGGGLGGNAGAADPPTIWGSATLSFSDCNHLTLTYASNPGLPSFVPQGSGTRSWIRLGRVNGMNCE